ncbi:hypothetical protein HN419_06110 [Candidatus Woesearchaeota archaeon]|jgi:hypothetical protein|nr:hypothetical protein [Candidatus Woesearchaeota archaeon]MBT3537557.1 hypothetical protein [Candidatus Woesearchaeota archaeon]MBT4698383.1 hypothetical protein [Candidatus Woesearchaeota archaeon]MBT4716540.1 hypothetical protein [Candidatus Woesearchaeota archaeon]MBT7105226.1 hypothetical protein [Candidatus Woesearchaeota archaeon]
MGILNWLKRLFRLSKPIRTRRRTGRRSRRTPGISKKNIAKANRKYSMLLNKFKKTHRRKPTKDDLFRVVIAASHHTFPVKGRNVRRWTKGRQGHMNRQKVRKYLLEKHGIVKKYTMR